MINKKALLLIVSLVLMTGMFSGCGTVGKVFNPYEDEFACPYSDPGMCTSVKKAYDASLVDVEEKDSVSEAAPCETGDCPGATRSENVRSGSDPQSVYQQHKYETLAGLIQEEEPPVVIPPEVVRVLILSYTGSENEMFGFRYAYFFASDPKWMPSMAVAD